MKSNTCPTLTRRRRGRSKWHAPRDERRGTARKLRCKSTSRGRRAEPEPKRRDSAAAFKAPRNKGRKRTKRERVVLLIWAERFQSNTHKLVCNEPEGGVSHDTEVKPLNPEQGNKFVLRPQLILRWK
ncbi:hypothetical protein EYF80_021221 [Liparis tanakae]|uniref:Uncharacterized protein n=1 Tax=Liparis tanakae TaxID=230148 RepID=A0A4Z2HTD1_9TELE|nr:hypothetical protein EYF80_021221 [Liparis tanakae]